MHRHLRKSSDSSDCVQVHLKLFKCKRKQLNPPPFNSTISVKPRGIHLDVARFDAFSGAKSVAPLASKFKPFTILCGFNYPFLMHQLSSFDGSATPLLSWNHIK